MFFETVAAGELCPLDTGFTRSGPMLLRIRSIRVDACLFCTGSVKCFLISGGFVTILRLGFS